MPSIEVPETFVMPGTDSNGKALLSVIEAKVLSILKAQDALFSFRVSATAANIGQMADTGLARYRFANRLTPGKMFDPITGAVLQRPAQKETRVAIDQQLTIKWMPDMRDMLRFRNGGPDVRSALMTEWAKSVPDSFLNNWEAIYFQGVKDYCLAFGQFLTLDLSSLTPETAVDAYYTINNKNIELVNYIDETQIGTDKASIHGALYLNGYAQLTKAFQRIVNMVAAETLATGKLYSNDILGVSIEENFFLAKAFLKDDKTKLNVDETYDLSILKGLFIHNEAMAMPISFQNMQAVIDNETGFPKFMGLAMYALPTGIRGWLQYIVVDKAPVAADITAAQANLGVTFGKEDFRAFTPPTLLLEKANALNEAIKEKNASANDPNFIKLMEMLEKVLDKKVDQNIFTKADKDKILAQQKQGNEEFLKLNEQFKEALITLEKLKAENEVIKKQLQKNEGVVEG